MVPRKQQADCVRGPYTLLLGQAVTEHIFGLIAAGETDEQRLVISRLVRQTPSHPAEKMPDFP
jgi:hypothetical protein